MNASSSKAVRCCCTGAFGEPPKATRNLSAPSPGVATCWTMYPTTRFSCVTRSFSLVRSGRPKTLASNQFGGSATNFPTSTAACKRVRKALLRPKGITDDAPPTKASTRYE